MAWYGRVAAATFAVCACSNRDLTGDFGDGEGSSEGAGASSSFGSVDPLDSSSSSADASDGSGEDGPQGEDSEWLFAMATSLSPATPLQWHVVTDWEAGELVEIRFQSLSLDQGSTTIPREPVGDAFVPTDMVVDDTGQFGVAFADMFVPGAANPITGSDIRAEDVRFAGTMPTADSACGQATGTITAPIMIPLEGSTFAAVRITSLAELPLEFPAACE
jgi:hypothetical protein